jgi:(p)ppGpp synthase/HD superfamily hydrolase
MIKDQVVKAYQFSQEAHKGQKRKFSGLDYFTHPKYVARVVSHLTKNPTLVVVALLHDVVEDTKVRITQIEDLFGEEVSKIVAELTTDNRDPEFKKDKGLYLANKMLEMSSGALTVKLADRFHNVLFLEGDDVDIVFKKKYWSETKTIMRVVQKMRKDLDKSQEALIKRILAILKFLEIRHDW